MAGMDVMNIEAFYKEFPNFYKDNIDKESIKVADNKRSKYVIQQVRLIEKGPNGDLAELYNALSKMKDTWSLIKNFAVALCITEDMNPWAESLA